MCRCMTLADIVFTARKLAEKYGVEGKVAGRYVEAGYSVRMRFKTSAGVLSFVAKKESTVLAVDVVSGAVKVSAEDVRRLAEKAKSINARPVLILYGAGPVLTDEAKSAAKELGVSVRRIRS